MEITFTTVYNKEALVAMARGLRKTARRRGSSVRYFFLAFIVVLCVFFTLPAIGQQTPIGAREIFTWLVVLLLAAALLFEDQLNGFFAGRRAIVKNDTVKTTFTENGYVTESTMGISHWSYDKIRFLAESEHYFIFLLSNSHGQVYDKRTIDGVSEVAFRGLIKEWTEKEIKKV